MLILKIISILIIFGGLLYLFVTRDWEDFRDKELDNYERSKQ